MYDPTQYTKGQQDFLDQYTRKLLVDLARGEIECLGKDMEPSVSKMMPRPFYLYAKYKGWLTKKDAVSAKGYSVVVSRLKRGG